MKPALGVLISIPLAIWGMGVFATLAVKANAGICIAFVIGIMVAGILYGRELTSRMDEQARHAKLSPIIIAYHLTVMKPCTRPHKDFPTALAAPGESIYDKSCVRENRMKHPEISERYDEVMR